MIKNVKKIIGFLYCLAFCTAIAVGVPQIVRAAEVAIDVDNFPDYDFRNYILQNCDLDNNNILSEEEIAATTSIDIYNKHIYILDGIEYFTALTKLNCCYNNLVNLDLSKNIVLEELACNNSKLVGLDLDNNTVLEYLDCNSNQLTSLDLSNNTALEHLDCSYNQLTNLDLSKNTALEYLSCYFNQLANLDLSKSAALKDLHCSSNQLTSLDLSKSTALENLNCYSNQLINLDLSQNIALEYLSCESNQLTNLDLSQNTFLHELDCGNNNLTSLDVSQNPDLIVLNCYDNQLTSLDLSKNTDLRSLGCDNNKLTELDLSHNILLGSFEGDGSLSYTGNKLQNIKFSMCLYPYLGFWDYDDVTILDNIKETDYGFIVTDPTKPAKYQYSCNGESIKCTLTYVNPYNETISTPISDKHLFNDYEYTNQVSGSSITIYGNGGTFQTGTTKTTNKQFTAYTDITDSYIYTLNNKGIVKLSSGKVIAGITKSDAKPVVTKNKITDTSAANIAKAKIKNGQITVTAVGKEGGLVYLWVIDTGNKVVSASCPINVKLAPKKLEIQDTAGSKLKNTKLANGNTLEVCVAGLVGSAKTDDCTYTATVDSKYQSYITVTPVDGSTNKFTIKATGLKNNKDTKAVVTFKCDQNGKKTNFSLTITK